MKMPVFFLGHGSPMNALEDNGYSLAWQSLSLKIPKEIKAFLVISAHWESSFTLIQNGSNPKQIYDFRGFPEELYQLKYQPLGAPNLAAQAQKLIPKSELSSTWGLDHGAWSVLNHLSPFAKIPTFQMSINRNLSLKDHLAIGKKLQKLSSQGVVILGSGNMVHNLRSINWSPNAEPYSWAEELNELLKTLIDKKDFNSVASLDKDEPLLLKAGHPTLEHFIPLLYTLGAASDKSSPEIVVDGIDLGSISMTGYMFKE